MQLFVVILKKLEIVDELLNKLANVGVRGGTILDGTGMAKALSEDDTSAFFKLFKDVFVEEVREKSKVMMFVLNDDQLPVVKETVHTYIKSFNLPNTGIMFSLPVNFVEGLNKQGK